MSSNTWVHRLVRRGVRPLVDTPVTPNQLTTLRLLTGLLAVGGFAAGTPRASAVAGTLCLISALLDRADGELARLGGKTSSRGHASDMISDSTVTILTFVGWATYEMDLHNGRGDEVIPLSVAFGTCAAPTLGILTFLFIGLVGWLVFSRGGEE